MPTFRAYLLDSKGHIGWGDWIEAADVEQAQAMAHELCSKGAPVVELWQGANRVAEIPCRQPDPPLT